jgi:XTP/dITP diphosphohydrolase
MKIIFATGNTGKLKEVKKIFNLDGIEIISPKELGFDEEIEEIGETFEENAFIKADVIFEKYHLPVIADDSGLAVDQLGGQPGVYSARYAGINVTYSDNNEKLLNELKDLHEPHPARFICCAVFVNEKNRISVQAELEGEIVKEFKGENGFGYDPIFKPSGFKTTLAEMVLEEKNKISHRAKAFNLLKKELRKLFIL